MREFQVTVYAYDRQGCRLWDSGCAHRYPLEQPGDHCLPYYGIAQFYGIGGSCQLRDVETGGTLSLVLSKCTVQEVVAGASRLFADRSVGAHSLDQIVSNYSVPFLIWMQLIEAILKRQY
jgi:hypothetical protein